MQPTLNLALTLFAGAAAQLGAAARVAGRQTGTSLRQAHARWRCARYERAALRSLRELDERTLKDIGLDPSELWFPAVFGDVSRMPRGSDRRSAGRPEQGLRGPLD